MSPAIFNFGHTSPPERSHTPKPLNSIATSRNLSGRATRLAAAESTSTRMLFQKQVAETKLTVNPGMPRRLSFGEPPDGRRTGPLKTKELRCHMASDDTRTCIECEGTMSPIVIMDKYYPGAAKHRFTGSLEYRLPEDRLSFWSGKYPTAGAVQAFLCGDCGRIALYGSQPDA